MRKKIIENALMNLCDNIESTRTEIMKNINPSGKELEVTKEFIEDIGGMEQWEKLNNFLHIANMITSKLQ